MRQNELLLLLFRTPKKHKAYRKKYKPYILKYVPYVLK